MNYNQIQKVIGIIICDSVVVYDEGENSSFEWADSLRNEVLRSEL